MPKPIRLVDTFTGNIIERRNKFSAPKVVGNVLSQDGIDPEQLYVEAWHQKEIQQFV